MTRATPHTNRGAHSMRERRLSLLDRLITEATRYCAPSPAGTQRHPTIPPRAPGHRLSAAEPPRGRPHVVNHTGEVRPGFTRASPHCQSADRARGNAAGGRGIAITWSQVSMPARAGQPAQRAESAWYGLSFALGAVAGRYRRQGQPRLRRRHRGAVCKHLRDHSSHCPRMTAGHA